MNKLELININKVYNQQTFALKNINLHLKEGEFLVLVGPSGCGKSTLLRIIAGLEKESSGEIFLSGKKVNNLSPNKRNMSMVFQNYALYPHMTVEENLRFPLKIKKISKTEQDYLINEISNLIGLGSYLKRLPKELSGGQRQRVALGRALIREPDIFLFDEPLSNLDAKLRNQIRSEIIKLHKSTNSSSVYVTHDQIEAMTMANRIVLMNLGEIIQIGTPKEIYKKPKNLFAAKFLGSPEINVFQTNELVNHKAKYPFIKFNLKSLSGLVNYLGIRSEDILIEESLDGKIPSYIEYLGDYSIVHFTEMKIKVKTSHIVSSEKKYILRIDEVNILKFDKNEDIID